MYPNLYYAFKDIFGVEWNWLRIFNSFGFFVALSFIAAAVVLTKELRRKEGEGLLTYTEQTIMVGRPATIADLLINFILGFLLGYKLVGLFTADEPVNDPQVFIFSGQGNLPAGLLLGLLLAGLKYWERSKQKLDKPEPRTVRIWPHDRVGDMVIFAAVFGFLGAKIFHNLENWDDLVRSPLESLLSFSGLTFYGGLICAAVAISYYARKHKIGFWHLGDAIAPALMIAYAVGRIGCQVAGDGDWGIINSAYVTTPPQTVALADTSQFRSTLQANESFYTQQFGSLDAVQHASVKAPAFLPNWMVAYTYPHNVINEGVKIPTCTEDHCSILPLPVFPTPFYETVVCTIFFLVLMAVRKRIRTAGVLFGLYMILNGVERFLVEKIRVNTTYSIMGFHPTQAEIISFCLVLAGLAIILIRRRSTTKTA